MNTTCEKCRALEYIDSGVRNGAILDLILHPPIYNCCCGHNIILDEHNYPCCGDGECKDQTTRRGK